jgi:hypothetical protein
MIEPFSMMKIVICSFLFQCFFYLAICQTKKKDSTVDSVAKIIQQLPEYKAEQKRVDSIGGTNKKELAQFGVGVLVVLSNENKIADAVITEDLDTVRKIAYRIKYDVELKKVISIKKQY